MNHAKKSRHGRSEEGEKRVLWSSFVYHDGARRIYHSHRLQYFSCVKLQLMQHSQQ
jgi:L-ascorbate metabolism protein UlaG (beta-lactamase superfamily)